MNERIWVWVIGIVVGVTLLVGFVFNRVNKNIEKMFDGYRFD